MERAGGPYHLSMQLKWWEMLPNNGKLHEGSMQITCAMHVKCMHGTCKGIAQACLHDACERHAHMTWARACAHEKVPAYEYTPCKECEHVVEFTISSHNLKLEGQNFKIILKWKAQARPRAPVAAGIAWVMGPNIREYQHMWPKFKNMRSNILNDGPKHCEAASPRPGGLLPEGRAGHTTAANPGK